MRGWNTAATRAFAEPDYSADAMSYDYEAKGRGDFAAGKRDERLYGDCVSEHARRYRHGWQSARRGAATPKIEPATAPIVDATPQNPDECPFQPDPVSVFSRSVEALGDDELAGTSPELVPASKTAASDGEQPRPAPSAEREAEPRKEPDAGQLDLFS